MNPAARIKPSLTSQILPKLVLSRYAKAPVPKFSGSSGEIPASIENW